MPLSTRIQSPERTPSRVATLKVEFTEAEAFSVYHAVSAIITDLDAEVKRLSDIYFSATRPSGERQAALTQRDFVLAKRTALKCARIAMADAGL